MPQWEYIFFLNDKGTIRVVRKGMGDMKKYP